jgi:hypothetical protein
MRHAIAAAITGAGMTAAAIPGGVNSEAFFTGTMGQLGMAISSMMVPLKSLQKNHRIF